MKKLIAFHGKPELKESIIAQLELHYKYDEIIKGTYWEDGKGCAVGCTIHGSEHNKYETELGIPQVLAELEDSIFEGLPNDLAKEFPLRFTRAINVGADLSIVHKKWFVWMLTDKEDGVIKHSDTDAGRKAIQDVSDLYSQEIKEGAGAAWDAAWDAARDAAWAARDAARAAARAAAGAAAWAAARDAARTAARDAAWAAARAAAWAAARDAARDAAWDAARIKQADKLIELLSEAK